MIQVTPQMKILLAVEPVDFRKGIDGLVALCRQQLQVDPLGGAVFVFRGRSGKALRCLSYDGQGYWLCQKRLSQGRFGWWPGRETPSPCRLEPAQLHLLLWNGDPLRTQTAPLWRPIAVAG
jgi:transposase